MGFGAVALWQAINMGHFSNTPSYKNLEVCSKPCSGSAYLLGGEAEQGLGQQCWGGGSRCLLLKGKPEENEVLSLPWGLALACQPAARCPCNAAAGRLVAELSLTFG